MLLFIPVWFLNTLAIKGLRLMAILLLLCSLAGCAGLKTSFGIGRPLAFDNQPPPGPPEYQQGWSDGCESALSGYGSQFTKAFHSLKKDGALINNPDYQRVWRDAYDYCRVYIKTTVMHGYGNFDAIIE